MDSPADRLTELSPQKRQLLEAMLRKKRAQEAAAAAIPPRGKDCGPLPLSFSQERLWLLDQFEPGSPAYNLSSALRFTGGLDVEALRRTLDAIRRRHESLRTRFAVRDEVPVQVVDPPAPFALPLVDLEGLPAERREEEVLRQARLDAARPFDLQRGPLFRAALLRVSRRDHGLLAAMHHIVSDGWSLGVFTRELGLLYPAFSAGKPSPLPPLPIQYPDFAIWQRRTLDGEALEKQLDYWRERLAGLEPVLDLQGDRPRPAQRTRQGDLRPALLPEGLSRELRALSGREGTTLFTTLLAGFLALLRGQTGREDLCLGTPVAGRRQVETEGLIGFFVNTLVLRADLGGAPSFRELVARVHQVVLDAQAHQDLPFERLVSELTTDRSLSHAPIFQVLFALQNTSNPSLGLPELAVDGISLPSGSTKFDLSLLLRDTGGAIGGGMEYSLDLFDPATIERLLGRFEALMAAAAADPSLPLTELPALLPAERHQALAEWNDTARAYETGVPLHELVARQAARTPEAVAVAFEDETLTYRELDRRANRLAHLLGDLGVRPDGRVGVLMERSPEMIVALLGVLRAGAAYVPLDPTYPAGRLAVLVGSSGARAVIAQGRLLHLLPEDFERTVLLDRGWDGEGLPATAPEIAVDEENLAYALFTSGSTGSPKGVMIPHRGIVNRLLWMQEAYGLTPEDRVLQKTPFSFDVSLWEFFWPLLTGARLVFARPEGHRDPAYLAGLIAREGITTLHFVPSMLQAFLEAPEATDLPSLRRVMASGEALPPELVKRFFSRISHGATLNNLYGPTEASVDVSFWACDPDPARSTVPIGRPIANLRLYVADREQRLQPTGVAGELLLGGVGLARGYLGRPDLTAAAFVPDPFGEVPGARLYRTGDLVRALPDGNVEFLGRIDHQVKIRGFRIELGEIEAVLAAHPGVRECVVVAREDVPGAPFLAAYVAGTAGTDELRDGLAQRLPEYMVPAVFVHLDALPLSPNGKVDRKALPAPSLARPEEEVVAPRNSTEEMLVEIWKELLRVERVGVEDRFFELGGNSLLATQVLARVKHRFGVEVTLQEVFRTPTVAGLAALVDARAVEPTDEAELAALLAELEGISDEEAKERAEGLR